MALTGPPSASMNPDVDAETGGGSTTSTNNTNNRSSSNKKLVEIALSPPRDKNGSTQTMVVVRSGGEAGRITDVRATNSSNSLVSSAASSLTSPGKPKRSDGYTLALLAAIMGNVLEFYDFSVYAFFAPEIGKLFFPAGDATMRAVKTFTVFAGGFLMRPLGSLVLGAVGDKYGTAAALKWSIALMTIPTVITGCLPTYQKVGIAAPLLLTACRLLQGLSVGGELIGALLHTADHSPPEHRGFFCGLVAVFGSMGNLIGSLVSVVMRHALTNDQLLSWGWRIPFLTGSVLGFVGIFLRTQTGALKEGGREGEGGEERGVLVELAETPAAVEEELVAEYHHAAMGGEGEEEGGGREGGRAASATNSRQQQQHPPHAKSFCGILREAAAGDKPRFLRVVCFAALNNALFYFHFVWLGTYLAQLAPNPLRAAQAFSVTCVTQAVFIIGNPLWGAAGDAVGGPSKRLRWNVTGVALSCFLPPCLFLLLGPGKLHLCFLYAVLTGLLMGFCVSGNYYAWVCESLQESPSRFLTTSVAYNLGAIVGGCTPMLASALAESKLLVAPYLPISALAVAVFVVLGSYEFDWGLVPGWGKGGREGGAREGEFLSLPMTAAEEEEAMKRQKKSMEKLKKRDGRGARGGEEEEAVEMVGRESL